MQATIEAPKATGIDPLAILGSMFTPELGMSVLRGVIAFALGMALVRLAAFVLRRLFRKAPSQRTAVIAQKVLSYGGTVLVVILAFKVAGIDVTALLGAAGIAGIAIGFAAQTSFANVISGLFLLSEKSFASGDVIQVGDIVGVVDSIDVLSVKVQTFDNRLVRIPNENLIKSNLINITRYPIRRMNFEFTVGIDSDLELVRTTLLEVADANPFVLKNPEPFFLLEGITNEGHTVFFGTWFRQERLTEVRNSMYVGIAEAFKARKIRYASRTLKLDTVDRSLATEKKGAKR